MTEPPETQVPAEEPQRERPHRRALRYGRQTGHWLWVALLVAAAVFIVILIAENTRHVKVGWVFGYSHISLVYLVVFAVVLGWLLGIATTVLLRRRVRRTLAEHEDRGAVRG
ncbi:MAG TPA: hypothetical protein VE982_06550 [Gaiellaceae bacterium]|nr:hypothetical protein [Gaiellaceae bacterium]